MAYYAIPENGNYAVYQVGGGRVSTTSAAGLIGFGLSTSNLGSSTPPVTTPPPTQTTTTTQPTQTQTTTPTQTNTNTGGGGSTNTSTPTNTNTNTNTNTGTTNTSTTTTTPPKKSAPLVSLQPGATGDQVKQLQDYLVQQGFLTQAQEDTGYGTYGPQTTAAVQAWQSANGVDNSSGPGYWGPKSIAQYQVVSGGTTQTNTGTSTGTNATTDQATVALNSKLNALGLTQTQIDALDPTQKALLATIGDIATSTYSKGGGLTLQQAIDYAKADPNILAKYGDALKVDTTQLNQGLADLQFATNQSSQQTQQQFENDRKALAEQQAANGTAYSGFRSQAQNQLGTQESGIVASSRSALQKSLNDMTTAFESKYGTAATTPASLTYNDPLASATTSLSGLKTMPSSTTNSTLTGATSGGITGSQPLAEQADVLNKASSIYQLGQLPSEA